MPVSLALLACPSFLTFKPSDVRRANVHWIYPQCFHSIAHSLSTMEIPNPFRINHFHTLSHSTEGGGVTTRKDQPAKLYFPVFRAAGGCASRIRRGKRGKAKVPDTSSMMFTWQRYSPGFRACSGTSIW